MLFDPRSNKNDCYDGTQVLRLSVPGSTLRNANTYHRWLEDSAVNSVYQFTSKTRR